jgi:hypothetical protein
VNGYFFGSLLGLFLWAIAIGGCIFFKVSSIRPDELGFGQALTIGVAVVSLLSAVVVGGMMGAGLATRGITGAILRRRSRLVDSLSVRDVAA